MSDPPDGDPGALVASGAPGHFMDPATGDHYCLPSSFGCGDLDPVQQEIWSINTRLASMERTVEWIAAEKTPQTEARPAREAVTLETYTASHGAAPAVAEMAQALEGWDDERRH